MVLTFSSYHIHMVSGKSMQHRITTNFLFVYGKQKLTILHNNDKFYMSIELK